MKYIINKTVLYSPESKQLSLLLENESYVALSNQAARLIVEMVQNNKSTLTREYLLKHVWEDFGSTPSNNSLYMAISELRKALKNLGIDYTVITTVPKTGFIFDAEIDILQVSQPEEQSSAEPTESAPPLNISNAISRTKTKWFLSIMLLLLCLFTVSYFWQNQKSRVNPDYLDVSFTEGKCTFYTLATEHAQDKKQILNFIDSTLVKNTLAIDCQKNDLNIYYQIMPAPINEIFITSCEKEPAGKNITCNTLRTDYD